MTAVTADPLGPFWQRDRPTAAERRNDLILAAVMLVATAVSTSIYDSVGYFEDRPELWVTALWVVAITVPLALRRVFPESVALVIAAAFVAGGELHVPELLFANISLFMALYTVGAWDRNRTRSLVVRGVIVFGMFVWLFASLVQGASANTLAPDAFPEPREGAILDPVIAFGLVQVITNLLYFGGAWYFGSRAWQSARDRAALQERTAELMVERERVAEQAVALERVRIARELHDVVAHHVSLMGVHAGAARRVFESNPEQARASLSVIESSARGAVDELHRLLGALRQPEETPGAADTEAASISASTRGIAQLPELLEEARTAGHPVTLESIGDPRSLPPTVELVIYRVVQESLTNARKHAGAGAPVDVRLRYMAESVEIEVSDGGTGAAGAPKQGGGLGHIGMRERVAAVGGSITIGPRKRGGFVVRAVLPVPVREEVGA
ncbi:sensor histidine kinase [Microbacteriaceae bacterium 4G12]